MQAVKTVRVPYGVDGGVLTLLEAFRGVIDHCIHAGVEKNLTLRFKVQSEVYYHLGGLGLHSWYSLSAVQVPRQF